MKAWERQEGETSKSYACFLRYLEMGPHRSLQLLFQGRIPGHVGRWSSKWKWPDRAAAYDASIAIESVYKAATVRDGLFVELSKYARKAIIKLGKHIDSKDARISLRACSDYLDRMGVTMSPSASSIAVEINPPEIPDGCSPLRRDELMREWCARGTPDRLVELERLARDPSLPATKRADLIELLNSYGGLAVPRRVDLPKPEPEPRKRELSTDEELDEFKRLGYVQ